MSASHSGSKNTTSLSKAYKEARAANKKVHDLENKLFDLHKDLLKIIEKFQKTKSAEAKNNDIVEDLSAKAKLFQESKADEKTFKNFEKELSTKMKAIDSIDKELENVGEEMDDLKLGGFTFPGTRHNDHFETLFRDFIKPPPNVKEYVTIHHNKTLWIKLR